MNERDDATGQADDEPAPTDIAIVGMSGRFPGAPDVDRLWERVSRGEDCLTDLDVKGVVKAGVSSSLARSADYVLRDGMIDGVDRFDREFFGFGRQEAAVMDPQHRHFLECAWEALESAAHDPDRFDGAIGVFAGSGMNTYLLSNLLTNPELVEQLGWFLLRHTSNDKDFLTTTLSYRLGLTGPSVNVQTACSTSLVAVHLAVQSLLAFESDLALAGGVTIEFPHGSGYLYREGEILSPSGRCRAFDAGSEGTVLTGGVAVVALRRLADAIDDGDPVLAVIKGSAVNNDGNRKVGYLAPSVDGHADAVAEALALAEIDPRTIGLLEAHGTGTSIGDPIEVTALTEAFRSHTDDRGFCRLTSTKPNIGHLDTAAGGASLIKVVQALRHRTLPPMANHTGPSPLLDIERTPFVLSDQAEPWVAETGPRRAGVSSLGVGGTNAHVIVEEAPDPAPTPEATPGQVLTISAADPKALDEATERLAAHFETDPTTNPADVAHTLRHGRRMMPHRRVVVVTSGDRAAKELRTTDRRLRPTATAKESTPKVVFTFPGGGAQYAGMGAGLDDRFDVFHEVRASGVEIAARLGHTELASLLGSEADPSALLLPTNSLPAVFLTSVALARQWMAWGVEPDAMIGHSLGEYVAAHLAGVLSFEDAMRLVLVRSRLMEQVSGQDASMLVVPLPESEITGHLGPNVSLATVNADDECVVAGPANAIDRLAAELEARDVEATRIPLAAAAHSSMLDPVLDRFLAEVEQVSLAPPQRPYVSNLTGDWITEAQATDPRYWVDHLRQTVRFADGLRTVLADSPAVVVELGPGHSLSSYARRSGAAAGTISCLRHADHEVDDTTYTLGAFAQLWLHGGEVDLDRFAGPDRRKLRLPTYPFQGERCWIEPGTGSALGVAGDDDELTRIDEVAAMGWRPRWRAADITGSGTGGSGADAEKMSWLILGDGPGDELAAELVAVGHRAARIDLADPEFDLALAMAEVDGVVLASDGSSANFDDATGRWLDLAPDVVRRLAAKGGRTRFVALTTGALAVDEPAPAPIDALALGPVLVAPKEYEDLSTALVDIAPGEQIDIAALASDVIGADGVVARRDGRRLVPDLVPTAPDQGEANPGFRRGGCYLITGGLGGVGAELAAHLAETHEINLVLTSTEPVPTAAERARFLQRHPYDHPTCRRIRQITRLEQLAVKVEVVVADLDDPASVGAALDEAERLVGPLDGAIHAAGRLRDRPIETSTIDDQRFVVDPKAGAALALAAELERRGAELLVLISSTSTELAPAGQAAYVAANSVLDAMAGQRGTLRVATLGFGLWAQLGMAAEAAERINLGLGEGDPVDHPVLGQQTVDHRGRIMLTGWLTTGHHWLVDEHRTGDGLAILPGTGHLELFLAAKARIELDGPSIVANVSLLAPLAVAEGAKVAVRVVVEQAESGRRRVRIESDGGSGVDWMPHSEAVIIPSTGEAAPRLDLAGVERRCSLDNVDPMSSASAHLTLGPRWSSTVSAGLGDGEAVGRLRLPVEDGPAWAAHPALVDVATGFAVLVSDDGSGRLRVPIGYRRVESWAPVPENCAVHAVMRDRPDDDTVVVDLVIADDDGSVVLRIDGLTLRSLADSASLSGAAVDAGRMLAESGPLTESGRPSGSGAADGLLGLADRLGLRPDEGTAWLDHLASGRTDRLVVSSVDLDALGQAAEVEPETPATSDASGADGEVTIEDRLAGMWRDLLGLDEIGVDDDFFDLGGHSLIAIRLMTRIRRDLEVSLQLATLLEAPTVGALAAIIRAERPELEGGAATASSAPKRADTGHLVTINGQGTQRPLYIVHGAGGNIMFLLSLSRALGSDYPLYGFQAHGVNEGEIPDTSIEAMAERYVAELRQKGPGPYLLGGYSGGGLVTLEMTRRLQELGETVEHVILFDSVPAGKAEPGRKDRWVNLARHMVGHGLGQMRPYVRTQVINALRRYVPERAHVSRERERQERALGYTEVADHGFVNLFYYFSATANRYQTGVYDVDASVLKADEVWPTQPEDYHWGQHLTGRLDLFTVPGDHHSMFYAENAPALAAAVREVVARLDEVS